MRRFLDKIIDELSRGEEAYPKAQHDLAVIQAFISWVTGKTLGGTLKIDGRQSQCVMVKPR